MAVIVYRVMSIDGDHNLSVVADETGVEYALGSGREDLVLNSERPKKFAAEFEQDYGRKPESPEDWAECALYNMGMVTVSDPIENSYSSLAAAVRGERREIDKARKAAAERASAPKVFSDADMMIGPDDELEAVVDPEDGTVVALVLSFAKNGGNSDFLYHRVGGKWTNEAEVDITNEDMEYDVVPVSSDYISSYDKGARSKSDIAEPMTAAAASACPMPTQDIELNLANRQKAIEGAGYGPLNPKEPNVEFWREKADRWSVSYSEAKTSLCGNCAAFIKTPTMLDCIASGLSSGGTDESGGWDTIDAGELGYCEAFDFKCAASRTCDAWIVGGPVTEEK